MTVSRQEYQRRALIVHVVVFILLNSGIALINFQFSPRVIWFVYPLIGWGIGVALHTLYYTTIGSKEEDTGGKAAWRMRAFAAHLIVYLMVNIMLLIINLSFSPAVLWFVYPALGWGMGVIIHFLFSIIWPVEEKAEVKK